MISEDKLTLDTRDNSYLLDAFEALFRAGDLLGRGLGHCPARPRAARGGAKAVPEQAQPVAEGRDGGGTQLAVASPVAFLGPGTDGTAVSADLFVAERWPVLIQEMEEKFDLVIVDTSPVLPVTDGVLASAGCAMTVIVARRDSTTSAQLATALTSLERARCVMAGSVLSDARTERSYGYSGGYYRP